MKNFLFTTVMLAFCAVSAFAAQTNDHLFARNTYNDAGVPLTYDNQLSFMSSANQTLWLWLDDDEIYENETMQALTPSYYSPGKRYNEITYSALEFSIFVPSYIALSKPSSTQSVSYGDRLPAVDFAYWAKQQPETIDGIQYDVYRAMVLNMSGDIYHFSAKDAAMYEELGALRKDDAPLLGLSLTLFDEGNEVTDIPDILISRQIFVVREAQMAGLDADVCSYRNDTFFRIKVYGSSGIPHMLGDLDSNGAIDIDDITLLIDIVLGKPINVINLDPEYVRSMADMNEDGRIDIDDVTLAIEIVLHGNR